MRGGRAELSKHRRRLRASRPTCPTEAECRAADRASSASASRSCTSSSTTPARPGARRWRSSRTTAWDKVLDLNVKVAVLPDPRAAAAARGGRDARTTRPGSSTSARSTASQVPHARRYSYSASKAAMHQLTRVLARELGPQLHHRERGGAGAVRVEDDGLDAARLRRRDRGGVAAGPHRAPRRHGRRRRSSSPAAPVPTSPAR